MDEDDLPPKQGHHEVGLPETLGWTFSTFVMIALFFVVIGFVIYAGMHWLH